MRYPRRVSSARAHGTSKQDFWLSFSDLMSVLVLVFILILFYILYKYFVINAAYQEELNKMLLIESALSDKEAELALTQAELTAQQGELTSAQDELARQQLLLNLAQQAVDDSEAELKTKQSELDQALGLLNEREAALKELEGRLSAQQTKIDDQQSQLENQQAQLEALVGVRTRIIQLLSQALKDNNISATVDPENGSIMLESDVLFAYGSSTLTEAGKSYIDKFLPVYLSVLLQGENNAYISEIIIEGHTDNVDTYIKNLKLSQDRAYAVASYVLDNGYNYLTQGQKSALKDLLTANGRSFSDLIFTSEGHVDAEASRRVVFKFRLTDEQMIEQMQSILNYGN